MLKEREDYCTECREIVEYQLKKVPYKKSIRNKEYEFEITMAVCENCGEEVDIPGLLDRNAMEIDRQYRRAENIVQISDIQKLMEIYRIGKAPLSLSLGFGEITITRYLLGQMPSKEYSDIIRKAIERPQFMIEKLQENKEIIGETAYKKAMKAAQELVSLFKVSDKLLLTISYIFERAGEVTPLALQKLLYFIQGSIWCIIIKRYIARIVKRGCMDRSMRWFMICLKALNLIRLRMNALLYLRTAFMSCQRKKGRR